MALTEQQLVEMAKRGDNAAFGQLWERYERQVVAHCRRCLAGANHDPATDEQDLATDTFICVLHHLDQFEYHSENGADFKAWLLKIAKRICLKFLAKQRRQPHWPAPDEDESLTHWPDVVSVERTVEERDALRIAAQKINALPEALGFCALLKFHWAEA